MNVLLFVTSLITILALLTYAKIDSFRYFLGIEAKFESYMQTVEQVYPNKIAEDWYNTTKAKDVNAGKRSVADGSPRLSFAVLIDSKLKEKESALYQNTLDWAKKLMKVLYENKPFFKETMQKYPNFLDEILNGLGRAVEQLTPEQRKKLKTAADLMNLKLEEHLATPFYLMLKGCQRDKIEEADKVPIKQNNFISLDDNDPDDEEDNTQEALEYTVDNGYDSLLNYITLQNKKKVRVYLASKSLLQAITGQEVAANGIIEARTIIYQNIKNVSPMPEGTTEQFQSMVQGYLSGANATFLDFTVTKTNPSPYN